MLGGRSSAQRRYYSTTVVDTFAINFNNYYKLSKPALIPFSETVELNGKVLTSDQYSFSYSDASFRLSDSLKYNPFDTLEVSYRIIRLSLRSSYELQKLAYIYSKEEKDTIRAAVAEANALSPESIFGGNMEKSGTIVRGFTVGTTKDFSLQSGLRLQLSGRLSKDLEVVAALTDENTPIQPEGNTATLQELDKVFIQVKNPYVTGTFGDYELQQQYGEFGIVSRKLQGLEGEFNYKKTKGYLAVASSRGKYTTNRFNGSDGVQGPYRLSGENGEQNIIIIAGTEKVYVDGIEMKRGERNDYTIEYANAQITFTPNKLITSASRISVDFEYTDRKYSRNFFGAGVKSELFGDRLGVQFQYMREGDNQDAPIDITISDSDKAILAAAGDDRYKASKSGISLAQPDSAGAVKGTYAKVDTLINGNGFSYYRYNPGGPNSIYNVTFSYVGEGKGDYVQESLGNFQFTGINKGNYAPIVFLPLPELKQLGNFALNFTPAEGIVLYMELSGSLWDRNRFSTIDDGSNFGYARNIAFDIKPREIKIGSVNLGKIGAGYRDRYINKRFTTLDRINPVEFNRNYNIQNSTESEDEELREMNLSLIPVKELNVNSSYGLLKRGSTFKSERINNVLKLSDQKNYDLNYNADYVTSYNGNFDSKWLRQNGSGYYSIGKFKPGMSFLAENKLEHTGNPDSLISSSLKYYELNPYLELAETDGFNFKAVYSLRDDYLPLDGIMYKQDISSGGSLVINYSGIREFNTNLNITVRNKKYKEAFKQQGSLDNQTILVRSQSRFNFWSPANGSFYYEVATQKSAKLQKVFVKVTKGTGNYIYLGDLNNNGVQDENEFEPAVYDGNYILLNVPSEQLYPVINLKTSTKWKIDLGKVFGRGSVLGDILKPLSSETFWRIEENSRETDYKKIYLLHLSDFQQPGKTINGTNFIQQDLFLFENAPSFSMRFRYAQNKNMSEYNAGVQKGYTRERSMRITFKLIPEISNQTDLINKNDNLVSSSASNREREITSNNLTTDFSYRPERDIEVGFKINVGRSEDDLPVNPTIIDINSQTLRINFSFRETGRLRIELERDELSTNTTDNFIPFELTQGNMIGKNYFWRLNFDYKLTSYLQSTVSYNGRLLAGEKTVHTARAEVRAYF